MQESTGIFNNSIHFSHHKCNHHQEEQEQQPQQQN